MTSGKTLRDPDAPNLTDMKTSPDQDYPLSVASVGVDRSVTEQGVLNIRPYSSTPCPVYLVQLYMIRPDLSKLSKNRRWFLAKKSPLSFEVAFA